MGILWEPQKFSLFLICRRPWFKHTHNSTRTHAHVHTGPVSETTELRNFLWSCNTGVVLLLTNWGMRTSLFRPKHHLEDKSLDFAFDVRWSLMMRKPHITCHIIQTQTVVVVLTSADSNPIFGEVCTPVMGETEKSFLFLISPVHKGLHFPLCLCGRSYCLRLKGNSQWLQQRLLREKEWMSRAMQEREKGWEKRYEAQNISVCQQAES